jgi:shikimate dehydrogenase
VRDIFGTTRVAAVLGDPVAHSISPAVHNAAYAALGLDYAYVALRVPLRSAAAAFEGVRGLGLVGVNCTMPLKSVAIKLADRVSAEAASVRAANTLVNEAGTLVARNTDVQGFVQAARDGLGVELSGCRAVVLGAGGAARAVIAALHAGGAEKVVVIGRRRVPTERAASLAGSRGRAMPLSSRAASAAVSRSNLVINATPVGMRGDSLPPHVVGALGPDSSVMDLVYWPPETPLVVAAREAGAQATAGLGLLVHQAALAFTLFTGQQAPLEAMSAAAVAALARGRAEGLGEDAPTSSDPLNGEPSCGL